MSDLKYWVWLSSLGGVRYRAKSLLIAHFGGVREAYFARRADYDRLDFLNADERAALENKSTEAANRALGVCAEKGIRVITMQDAAYPGRLNEIYDPPLVLYVDGKLPVVDDRCAVAVIGTRSATDYGIKMAERMGYGITKCGGLVVSGLTRGIDYAAARGALLAGGGCIGVLGTAIDAPRDTLASDVAYYGALVSEYAPGAPTRASNFRARNRITSGLSVATLVVEAPERSGALLFVDEALSQGREVYAVPANADSVTAAGSNRLIIEGAHPALTAWDVLGGFAERFPDIDENGRESKLSGELEQSAAESVKTVMASAKTQPKEGTAEKSRKARRKKPIVKRLFDKKDVDKPETEEYIDLKKQLSELDGAQLAIVTAITEPHTHVDDIIERTALPATQVLSELTMLQIKGYVLQEPGKRFSLNISSQK